MDMDERQVQIRGKIFFHTTAGLMIILMGAAFLQDFGIFDIVKKIGFSDFLIASVILAITYASCALLFKDAYFGMHSRQQMTFFMIFFYILTVLEDVLFICDCLRGEKLSMITAASLLMVNSISISFLWKRRKQKRD